MNLVKIYNFSKNMDFALRAPKKYRASLRFHRSGGGVANNDVKLTKVNVFHAKYSIVLHYKVHEY